MLITIQKIRHFGILTAIGASKNNIHNIIFKQGFFTGLIGIFFGLLMSLGFIIVQNIFGLIKLPEDIYFTTSLPMIINASDLIVISAITLFMIFISSLIASKRIDSFKIINSIVSDK